jgi:3-hydroxymyristoyl/3-hydroxydecanoyl-(acyl carrier protein) dehydratase
LTFQGGLPAVGETVGTEVRVDGRGPGDGSQLVSFQAECRVGDRVGLVVRNGHAGFFTAEELSAARGVVWDAEDEIPPEAGVAGPVVVCSRRSFDPAAVAAFAEGRPVECFGPGWEATAAHLRSPRVAAGRMLLLGEVSEFDHRGGPWGRGYLRAELPVTPDAWFFGSHFPGDPCMPADLMFEGCLQAMSFYLAGLGYTIDRDGWRFEPVPGNTLRIRCGGEVTPVSRRLTYEVFVTGVSAGPVPAVFADVLCTVDGVRVMHARGVGLRLVPDWPLTAWRSDPAAAAAAAAGEPVSLLPGGSGREQVAEVEGFRFDYPSLLAWAWGKPSEAFGRSYAGFDGPRFVPRMPGPPFGFITRIAAVDGPRGGMRTGSRVQADYDPPADAWYWQHNGSPVMPLAVLMEVALQPCGWLGTYVGSTLGGDTDLLFRNLDGTATVTGEVPAGTRTIRTTAVLTSVARSADAIIESFQAECHADGVLVFAMTTVFGYFPKHAFDRQVGFPPTAAELAAVREPSSYQVDLTSRPARYVYGPPRLAGPMLLMIDRVTGYWPGGGRAGLGRLRSEKDVDPGEWFFKAHFFQDPVQPGSLGIEAMIQLLQYHMIEQDMAAGIPRPRFEPFATGGQLTWKYRGQVVPANTRITIEMEILRAGADDRGRYALAEAWLWVDGTRIYHAEGLGMRIVPDDLPDKETP